MKSMLMCALAISFSTNIFAAGDTASALETLKSKLTRYGAAKIDGTEDTFGKKVGALYFGRKKINSNYDAVDDVKKTHGGTATVFVKDGDEFVRISTNVLKDDGTRAGGTTLAHNKAYESIKKGEKFCGEVEILGSPYDTCYEPIKDASGATVGIFYVGYKK